MLRFASLLLPSFILGALSVSPLVDFQEQFNELSRSIEPQLRDYRAENVNILEEVVHRALSGLANLTTEMRSITRDTWAQIESHEWADAECLELLRPDFDLYVWYGEMDIKSMADVLHWYLKNDALLRFNFVASQAQRENSRSIYQTVQTLGRNQFLDNMAGTVYELQDELDYYQHLWTWNQERLRQEFEKVHYTVEGVEETIEWWHNFTVEWHQIFMRYQLDAVSYKCGPETITVMENEQSPLADKMLMKMEESRNRKLWMAQRDGI